MEILDLLDEKYDKTEYAEIKKIIYIREQNIKLLENFKNFNKLNNLVIESLKNQLIVKKTEIDELNNIFLENNRLFNNIVGQM